MGENIQTNAFWDYEADAWFDRNKEYMLNYSSDKDQVINLLKKYNLKPKSLLEIGCSAGYRLNGIKKIFKSCNVFGIEPSGKAIKYGKKHFKKVNFKRGTAENLSNYKNESIDIIIVGFVFYAIDRNIIFKVVAEIDRVLKNNGTLIIIDFFSETSSKTAYKHIKDFAAYSYKQNYSEIFTASKLYYLFDKSTLNHTSKIPDATTDYDNKYTISLLKKDTIASYK